MLTECLLIAKSVLTILWDRQYCFHFSDEETNSKNLSETFHKINNSYDWDSGSSDFEVAIPAANQTCLPGPPPWDCKLSGGRVRIYTLPRALRSGSALSGCSQRVLNEPCVCDRLLGNKREADRYHQVLLFLQRCRFDDFSQCKSLSRRTATQTSLS